MKRESRFNMTSGSCFAAVLRADNARSGAARARHPCNRLRFA
jgi:hypothetical protein